MTWNFKPRQEFQRIHCQTCGESSDIPPGTGVVWHRCKQDLLQADVRIHNVTAGQQCEPCARFSNMHPSHPGESANPNPALCVSNMRLRVEDFTRRLSETVGKPEAKAKKALDGLLVARCQNDGCGEVLQPTRSLFRLDNPIGWEAGRVKRILYCPKCFQGNVTP